MAVHAHSGVKGCIPSTGGSLASAAAWSVGSTPAMAANVRYQSQIVVRPVSFLPCRNGAAADPRFDAHAALPIGCLPALGTTKGCQGRGQNSGHVQCCRVS